MSETVRLLFPVLAIILLGYGAGRLRYVTAEGLAGLNWFVLYLALPALFFSLLAATPIDRFGGWQFVVTTTFSTYCAFAIAFSIAALLNGGHLTEATVEGVVGAFSGTALLAPALVLNALGIGAAAPMALILTFDLAMLLAVTPLMMAMGGTQRSDGREMARSIVRQIVTQPLIVATALGFVFASFGWGVPGVLDGLLATVRAAAAPAALFVFGLSLAFDGMEKVRLETPLLLATKLIVHPLIVYLLLIWVGGFDPIWLHTAVLVAALPPAADAVRWAERYAIYVSGARAASVFGALAAAVTVTVVVFLLVSGDIPARPLR